MHALCLYEDPLTLQRAGDEMSPFDIGDIHRYFKALKACSQFNLAVGRSIFLSQRASRIRAVHSYTLPNLDCVVRDLRATFGLMVTGPEPAIMSVRECLEIVKVEARHLPCSGCSCGKGRADTLGNDGMACKGIVAAIAIRLNPKVERIPLTVV